MPLQAVALAWNEQTPDCLSKLVLIWLMKQAGPGGLVENIYWPGLAFFARATENEVKSAMRRLHGDYRSPILSIADDMSACTLRFPIRDGAWDADGNIVPIKRSRLNEEDRFYVSSKTDWVCFACGSEADLQFDHIIPLAAGGADIADNQHLLCGDCNRRKGARVGWVSMA